MYMVMDIFVKWLIEGSIRKDTAVMEAGTGSDAATVPLSPFFLGLGASMEELLPLLGDCQEEEISWLWLSPSKNRICHLYIVLDTSPKPSDLTPDLRALGLL
jgi:hypothetical protein